MKGRGGGCVRKVRLHLGAHRTATTALQATLQNNAELLADHGIGVLTRWRAGERGEQVMRRVTQRLAQATRHKGPVSWLKRAKAKRELTALLGQCGQPVLLVSDENLLGHTFAYDGDVALYPQSDRRLAMLARTLGAPPERVHVTIRDYASFLVSIYSMAVLYRPGAPRFDDVRTRMLGLERRWPDILASVRQAFPSSQISFARYEAGPVDCALSALLTPDMDPACLQPAAPGVNRAPTVDAIEAALVERPGSIADADALNRRFAEGAPFDPLCQREKDRLTECYRQDLERLRSNYREICGVGITGAVHLS